MAKPDTVKKAFDLYENYGFDIAADKLGVSKETLRRYVRGHRKNIGASNKKINTALMRRLSERFSVAELKRLADGNLVVPDQEAVEHDFTGDEICFGVLTDTHLGSLYTEPDMLNTAFDEFSNNDVDFIAHCGDVHEGVSNRQGHVYECTHFGYSKQLDHSRDVFGQWTHTPVYMIDGNHDRWYIKNTGALIVDELCRGQDNLHFIGHDEGNINISGVIIKLWHGEDGSSYAFSYRIQKLVEAFTGGEKPNVLLCGHTHKATYIFDRHIHCVSAGSMQKQSKWMRSKRHASHTGFFIVKMGVNENGVSWFEPRFYPFYR